MYKDKDIEAFFKSEKHHYDDSKEFVSKVQEKLTYYHHYERLAQQLAAEKRHNRNLTIGFLGVSVVAIVLVLTLFELPIMQDICTWLSTVLQIKSIGYVLVCSILGGVFTLLGCSLTRLYYK